MNHKLATILGVSIFALSACATTSETAKSDEMSATKTEAPMTDEKVMAEEAMVEEKVVEEKMAEKPAEMSDEIVSEDPDVKGIVKTFSASQADAHAAAMAAMKQYGFEVKENKDDYLEGKRTSKMGVLVGSGGEKMKIALDANDDGTTRVHVRTKKTLVGIAGQKNWDDEVMGSIMMALSGS